MRRMKRCTEKEIKRKKEEKVVLKIRKGPSMPGMSYNVCRKKGRYVYCRHVIKKGQYITVYTGDTMSAEEGKKVEAKYAEDPSIGSYLMFFDLNGKSYCIDATNEKTKGIARLINHADHAEANLKLNKIMLGEKATVYFTAMKDIPRGEELCYDYGERRAKVLEVCPFLSKKKRKPRK